MRRPAARPPPPTPPRPPTRSSPGSCSSPTRDRYATVSTSASQARLRSCATMLRTAASATKRSAGRSNGRRMTDRRMRSQPLIRLSVIRLSRANPSAGSAGAPCVRVQENLGWQKGDEEYIQGNSKVISARKKRAPTPYGASSFRLPSEGGEGSGGMVRGRGPQVRCADLWPLPEPAVSGGARLRRACPPGEARRRGLRASAAGAGAWHASAQRHRASQRQSTPRFGAATYPQPPSNQPHHEDP